MKKTLLTLGFLICSMGASATEVVLDNDSSTITCKSATIFDTYRPIEVKLCSFREEWDYVYGANILEVISHTTERASKNVHAACEEQGLFLNRYIQGVAPGGIDGFSLESGESDGGVFAKATGNFYCTPERVGRYSL